MKRIWLLGLALFAAVATTTPAAAEVKLPNIFGDHMVLQQNAKIAIWGWADANEKVSVTLGDETVSIAADAKGNWKAHLAERKADGKPLTMTVKGKSNSVTFKDVLMGEVWLCSGQSNMQWSVSQTFDADLEIKTAKFPNIRLITVPQVGTQELQNNFNGKWDVCSPETVGTFSAAGFYFGRQLHQMLDVPVGLIDNAWGGSACEAWVRRDLLEKDEQYKELIARWETIEKNGDFEKKMANYKKRLEAWKVANAEAKKNGKKSPQRPRAPRNQLTGQHRPGNLYCGVLNPIIGLQIKGAIWYQGETNAGRAYQYRNLFPLMIQNWRDEWGIGDFPFYWVQLADFQNENPNPGDSTWAELREAQTMTMSKLENTGEAVIIDIGESNDIHPRNKLDVGRRLARWALAKQYGVDIKYRSPIYSSMEKNGQKIVLTFDHVGSGLKNHDFREVKGFAIAEKDGEFVWATAKIVGKNKVEVWNKLIKDPAAVRYAWANNPVCNLESREGLPVTPFRTDDRPGVTINSK